MNDQDAHIKELIAGAALDDLTCAEQAQLCELLASHQTGTSSFDHHQEQESLEIAAATYYASAFESDTDARSADMPQSLQESVLAMGKAWATDQQAAQAPAVVGRIDPHTAATPNPAVSATTASSPSGKLGWIAAAACLMLAGIIALTPSTPSADQLNPQAALAQLLATSGDTVIRSSWANPFADPAGEGVTGEVIWDPKTQTGFMTFKGLAANDPNISQYQLWIFDAQRPTDQLPQFNIAGLEILTSRPVDGGVFDIASTPSASSQLATGEVIVQIDPKLFVNSAAVFAVTVEPPGGVVVSDRTSVPVAAIVGG